MEDRYLFRGKNELGWCQGNLIVREERPGRTAHFIVWYDNGSECEALVDPKTIGQCTGLKDKDAKLIFEGDIVEGLSEMRGIVYWLNGGFSIKWCTEYDLNIIPEGDRFKVKIIGNIHEED